MRKKDFLDNRKIFFSRGSQTDHGRAKHVGTVWMDVGLMFPHHVGGEDQHSFMFAARPLRVIQQIGVVLPYVPDIIPCKG